MDSNYTEQQIREAILEISQLIEEMGRRRYEVARNWFTLIRLRGGEGANATFVLHCLVSVSSCLLHWEWHLRTYFWKERTTSKVPYNVTFTWSTSSMSSSSIIISTSHQNCAKRQKLEPMMHYYYATGGSLSRHVHFLFKIRENRNYNKPKISNQNENFRKFRFI